MITIMINGGKLEAKPTETILDVAQRAEIYIPTLCYHPNLPPRKGGKPVAAVYQGEVKFENHPDKTPAGGLESGCGLCVVERRDSGELAPACRTQVSDGMHLISDSPQVKEHRQTRLREILERHPHACLTCAQREGCPRSQCSSNVPENERCCPQLGNCELQKVVEYVGIVPATATWVPTSLPILDGDPLITRNYNLCISCTRCVRACRDLRGIEAIGFVCDQNGKVTIGSVAPNLKDSGCKFCTACVEVCPTGAIMDKGMRTQDKEKELLPCVEACPAGINIPWYVRFVAEGKADEAHAVMRQRVPLPGILGRVCVRPCESACRRGMVNESIAICALKRFATDNQTDLWKSGLISAPPTGKKVAVIGAGPGGLTAAFYLKKMGHKVTVYDAWPKAGGMMRYGIPRYRLPYSVLDREIAEIFSLGIDFQPNKSIGKDILLSSLRQTHDAVFIASGAPLSRKIPIDGLDLPQVYWGLDFLKEVNLGADIKMFGKVVVIGGGAAAFDVARTTRRLGAAEVHVVCLEDHEEMPAHTWEIKDAEEEEVVIHNCWGPMEVVEHDGRVRGICFRKCVYVFDSEGRFNPTYDDECTMGIEADFVIPAMGQSTDLGFVSEAGVGIENRLIKANEKNLETNVQGVFAGGDAVVFPGAIIHAVAAGRKAASSIDRYLGGTGELDETLVELPPLNPRLGREEGFAYKPRFQTCKTALSERRSFQEVDLGFGNGNAALEAKRCLQCDLRLGMDEIVLPPEHVLIFTKENVEKVPPEEGAFRLMDQEKMVILIKGTDNMRELLTEDLKTYQSAKFFDYKEDKMYSKRESELLQQHLEKYGHLPSGGGDEDDLF